MTASVSVRSKWSYTSRATLAVEKTIGRAAAVADLRGLKLSGFIAWLAWLFIHIMYLAQFENRVLVLWQWFFNWITRNRAARLITGEGATRPADPHRPVPAGEPVVKK